MGTSPPSPAHYQSGFPTATTTRGYAYLAERGTQGDPCTRPTTAQGHELLGGSVLFDVENTLPSLPPLTGMTGIPGQREMDPELLLLSQSCVTIPVPRHLEKGKKEPLYACYSLVRALLAHRNGGISIWDCEKVLLLFFFVLFLTLF